MSHAMPMAQASAGRSTRSSPAAPQSRSSVIPREVLTWLQALGLGSAAKNARRDLANGYVVAQICACYWPQVPLHSFANGVSTASKQSNWYVLRKVMRRHDIEVSPVMIQGMIDGSDDCAVAFLKQLYAVFTGKTLEETPVPLAEPLLEVPSKNVPVLTPSTANNAAARARQAADSASVSGASGAAALSSSAMSRVNAGPRGGRSLSFGGGVTGDTYMNGGGVQGQASAASRSTPGTLPPILPPPTSEAAFSAAAVTSGKPALKVAVRPAGQVSTVVPTQPAALSPANGDAAAAGVEGSHPPGTSLAARWFCAKVREAAPAEALDALSDSGAAVDAFTSALSWLAAPDAVVDAAIGYSSGEGDEASKENLSAQRLRVWRVLQSSAHDLADVVLHCSPHGLDLLVDRLFAVVRDTVLCDAAGHEMRSGVTLVRSVLQFFSSLLVHLSDGDAHFAVRCFQMYFVASDTFAAAARNVRWCVAKGYAELLVTALPANRGVAAAVLESLWNSLEDVVRDVDADAEGSDVGADVSLLLLTHALLDTLLPLHSGTAPSPKRSTSPAAMAVSAALPGRSVSDGMQTSSTSTRPPSRRVRSAQSRRGGGGAAAAAAVAPAAVEENAFDALVVHLAHQRCVAALLRVGQVRRTLLHSPDTVLLAETAAALAVDLLRVEAKAPLVAEFVRGDGFFDVYHVLFTLFGANEGEGSREKNKAGQQHDVQHPTLSVLRARWLRWCLQRRWQFNLTGHSSTTPWQRSPRPTPSLGGSTNGFSEVDPSPILDQEAGGDIDEVRALQHGLQMVCTALLTTLEGEREKEKDGSNVADARPAAKELMACAMAESLPFLPAQYKTASAADLPRNSAAAGDAGGFVNLLPISGDGSGENGNNSNSPQQRQRLQQEDTEQVYAETVAEAVMHVFMRDTPSAQMRTLLCAPSPASAPASDAERPSSAAAEEGGRDAVILLHPYVGPLTSRGPLVAHSDVLLLVKAMLCVLEAPTASSAKAAAEREVATVARRLGPRAAVMAREGHVEDGLQARIQWMHALLVEGQRPPAASAGATTATPSTTATAAAEASIPPPFLLCGTATEAASRGSHAVVTGDEATVAQWHKVILECWDAFMVVLQAATLRLRQRGGTAVAASAGSGPVDPAVMLEALGAELLSCAQQSQEVVRCLERELSSALPGRGATGITRDMNASVTAKGEGVSLNSALLSGPVASFVAGITPEEMQAAVGWMWSVVGGS